MDLIYNVPQIYPSPVAPSYACRACPLTLPFPGLPYIPTSGEESRYSLTDVERFWKIGVYVRQARSSRVNE